jgi:pimeloyl-ACP methyl ester carboxylesterase
MPYITTSPGIDIFYEELGAGDRHVLCTQVSHGKYSLERELARRGFHVYLLTNRGFGRSTHITEDYGDHWYDVFAADVIAVADQLGIDKFVYSGASHGAGTGWHVAMKYPERLHCFFAVVPGPHSLDEGKASFRSMMQQGIPMNHCFHYPTDDETILARRAEQEAAYEALRRQPDYEAVYNAPETQALDYGRPLRALGTEKNLTEALKAIEVPTLLVGGLEDTISRPDLMLRSALCLPNCKLVLHSHIGHDMAIWEEVADDAVRFYENVMTTGRTYSPLRRAED